MANVTLFFGFAKFYSTTYFANDKQSVIFVIQLQTNVQ